MDQASEPFIVRQADMCQLNEIMAIYGKARKFMAEHGNPTQWPSDYPPEDMIARDIEAGRMYVCMLGQKIGAVFYYYMGEEADYKDIWDGDWLDEEPYGVVHRIASEGSVRGAGSFCLTWAWKQCGNLKIDTHRDNVVMQNLLKKLGFQRCGLIRGRDGGERLAYQKRGRTSMTNIELKNKTILVTGAAGFIGSNLVLELFDTQSPVTVVGIDNMNDYYDVSIKEWRLEQIEKSVKIHSDSSWTFIKGDIADKTAVDDIFHTFHPDIVVNLAAQAGVRYSITNPDAYISSNLIGFYNILEACRHSYDGGAKGVEHLVYASSSSVYGSNKKVPYSTDDKVDNPVSLYAATKKSNELMAHAYSKLYNIPSTGLRFFTVYGPAGRPDMAYFGFTDKLLRGQTIQIFNYGNCKRDFTYVDDIVEGVKRVMAGAPSREVGEDGLPVPPYAVYNIGNQNPENLLDFVDILQQELIRAGVLPADYDFEAHKELVAMQPGDVPVTFADTSALERDYGFKPATSLRAGLRKFAQWYKEFYQI